MWLKTSLLIFAAFLFASCGNNKDFDEAEKLALEAAKSRDSLQVVADSLQTGLSLYEKEYNVLYKKVQTLQRDTTSLNIRFRDLEKKFVQSKQKPKANVSVGVASAKKESVVISRPDTSTKVAVADPEVDIDSKRSKISSFIEYIWKKRSKVEP